jgi:hypothetical protein
MVHRIIMYATDAGYLVRCLSALPAVGLIMVNAFPHPLSQISHFIALHAKAGVGMTHHRSLSRR